MGGNRTALLFAAVASLLVVVVAARGRSPVPSEVNDLTMERGLPGVPMSASSSGARGTDAFIDPDVVGKIILALVVLAFLLAVVLSVLSFLRNRRLVGVGQIGEAVDPAVVDTVPGMRLEKAVAEARDILARDGGRPGNAVIEAWVRLENAVEHSRRPHETATEFTVALLEKANADEAALRELRELYQRARFGHGGVDDIDGEAAVRARAALDRILATIR